MPANGYNWQDPSWSLLSWDFVSLDDMGCVCVCPVWRQLELVVRGNPDAHS